MSTTAETHDEIIAKTVGVLGSFLDEVSRNTSNYKSVHNLTEQIEHQYAGRFAIELIQNAHDPIRPDPGWNGGSCRIELSLEDSGEHGILLVANDGRPFRREDFEALSNLGQSSKIPQEAIGNKGIGFRSVLEVSRAPEVYSCRLGKPGAFDGYCFRFDPTVLDGFERVVEQVLTSGEGPTWRHGDISRPVPNVRVEEVRDRAKAGLQLRQEVRFLSPYSLPLPAFPSDPALLDLERRGFATVIRLPLVDAEARQKVTQALEAVGEDTVLFLPLVGSLTIRTADGTRRYQRVERPVSGNQTGRIEVLIGAEGAGNSPRRFWLWRKTYGELPAGAPEDHGGHAEARRLEEAVAKLPGNWKELRQAEVAIAVERDQVPRPGMFFIHLPTQQPTGCGAHLHAPFYGDMSRKIVDFSGEPINALLLGVLAELAHQILVEDLIDGGPEEGAAALDLTARQQQGEGTQRWKEALDKLGTYALRLFRTDKGWKDRGLARVLVTLTDATVVTRERLRTHACFAALSGELASREALATEMICPPYEDAEPTPTERCNTVDSLARALHGDPEVDWSAFLSEVSRWVRTPEEVATARILPDDAGVLQAARPVQGGPQIFFPPSRGERAREVGRVPSSLRSRVAFLSESIVTRDPGQTKTNALGSWLEKLIDDYRAETILSRVLLPALPESATDLDPEEKRLCRDALGWAVKLVELAEGEGTLLPILRKLRVPCRGGWYRAAEAIAGPGWTPLGDILAPVLAAVGTPEAQSVLERVLLPPDLDAWSGASSLVRARLVDLRITDGLHPMEPVAAWDPTFFVRQYGALALPPAGPPGSIAEQWQAYRAFVASRQKSRFWTEQRYEVAGIRLLPGLDVLEQQSAVVRTQFTELVVRSMPFWTAGWDQGEIRKVSGQSHSVAERSFLAHTLREQPWLWLDDESGEASGGGHRPQDRWYVPQLRKQLAFHFAHLLPLPPGVCRWVDEAGAGPALARVGLKRCPIEDAGDPVRSPDPALLDALATALEEGRVEAGAHWMFVSQVRRAWKWFGVGSDTALPENVVVLQEGSRPRCVKTGSEVVFLPVGSVNAAALGPAGDVPIVCMDRKDAEELAPVLTIRLPNVFLPLTTLRLEIEVGGQSWIPSNTAPRLADTEMSWLIRLALTVSAFSDQGGGVVTRGFRLAAAALRRVHIEPAPGLAVRVSRGDQLGTPHPQSAHLYEGSALGGQGDAETLLYDPSWPEGYSAFAGPLMKLLDRNDLKLGLKLALGSLPDTDGPPDRDGLLVALRAVEINEGGLQEVEAALAGDLGAMVLRLMPVARLLGGAVAAGRIARAQTQEELEALLSGLHPLLEPKALVGAARQCGNDREMGIRLHFAIGAAAELGLWNEALEALGSPYRPLSNAKALRDDLEEFRRDLRLPLRALARAVASDGVAYETARDAIEAVEVEEVLTRSRWQLPFREAMHLFLRPLEQSLPAVLLAELRDASDRAGWLLALERSVLSLDIATDPAALHGDNDRLCSRILREVTRTAIVWCGQAKLSVNGWSDLAGLALVIAARIRGGRGFLDRFDESRALAEVRAALPRGSALPEEGPYEPFWKALDAASSPAILLEALGLKVADLEAASEVLADQQEAVRRLKRIRIIAGSEFDTAADNLGALYEHIQRCTPPAIPLDLTLVSELEPVGKRRKGSGHGAVGGPPKKPGHGRRRPSQEVLDAIALAGEIHAYRWLQATYGPVVGPECWLSQVGTNVFPTNVARDGEGCDFRLKLPGSGITLHLEVKATSGDEPAFELGVSEVALARRVAAGGRRKKEVFRILHVLQVFAPVPGRIVLPNPYDASQRFCTVNESGAWVQYRRPRPVTN